MLRESILDHILLDHLAVLLFCLFLAHALKLLPCRVLVFAHKIEEARLSDIDISYCRLLVAAVDLKAFVGGKQHYTSLLRVILEEVGCYECLGERAICSFLRTCCH